MKKEELIVNDQNTFMEIKGILIDFTPLNKFNGDYQLKLEIDYFDHKRTLDCIVRNYFEQTLVLGSIYIGKCIVNTQKNYSWLLEFKIDKIYTHDTKTNSIRLSEQTRFNF